MKLLYGTTNRAKLDAMKRAVAGLPIELIGLGDLSGPLPKIEEDGATPLENAQRKARAYYEAFGIPVFSCDSGLYFDEVQPQEQPGIYVRRVNGRELNDEEMIWHYAQLAQWHGGQLTARYKNAICLILDADNCFSSIDPSLWTEPFLLVSKPHHQRVKGFPLDSLSKEIASSRYYYDLEKLDLSTTALEEGFRTFLQEHLPIEQR